MATTTGNTAAAVQAAVLLTQTKIATANAASTTEQKKKVAIAGLEFAAALYRNWPTYTTGLGSTFGTDAATLAIADSAYDAALAALAL